MENIKKYPSIHTKCIIHPFDPFVHFVVVHIMLIYFYYVFRRCYYRAMETWNMKKIPFNTSYFLLRLLFFFLYVVYIHYIYRTYYPFYNLPMYTNTVAIRRPSCQSRLKETKRSKTQKLKE